MSPTLGARCKKRRGKKEPPLWTVGEGLYWAVALGQNSRGWVSKGARGVCDAKGVCGVKGVCGGKGSLRSL